MIEGEALDIFERSLERAISDNDNGGAALDVALAELGWPEALSDDPRAAVSLLFDLQGQANVTSFALDRLMAGALGHGEAAVVLPALGSAQAPGALVEGRLRVHGLSTIGPVESTRALVVASTDSAAVAHEVDGASLQCRAVEGIDPSFGLVEVDGEVSGADEVGRVEWENAIALGQLALGHELVGSSRRMLELACEHALEREQFGNPIARFQAVRHRLAETIVAIEAARSLLDSAWLDGLPQSAAMAKATSGRSARVAARHCQQVLAGIGYTSEHPLHRYVRRVLVLEQLLGSTRNLTRELGNDIVSRRRLPDLLPL